MAFLRDMSNKVWNFVSPRKTVQRRDKPFKVPALPVREKKASQKRNVTALNRDMSPETLVKSWHSRSPTSDNDLDMDATLLPPSPPGSAQPATEDLEGATLLSDSPVSQSSIITGSSQDEMDANEDTLVVDDGTYMTEHKAVNVEDERKRREEQGRELREAGWPEDAVFLFQKLGLRGFEPIFPIDWLNDLETVPEDLFTANVDKAFIKAALGSSYHGKHHYSTLINTY